MTLSAYIRQLTALMESEGDLDVCHVSGTGASSINAARAPLLSYKLAQEPKKAWKPAFHDASRKGKPFVRV